MDNIEVPTGNYDVCIIGESLTNYYLAVILSELKINTIVIEPKRINETNFHNFSFTELLNKLNSSNNNDNFFNFSFDHINNTTISSPEIGIEIVAKYWDKITKEYEFSDLIHLSNKFNIDLQPFLLTTNRSLINEIIKFEISHYLDIICPRCLKYFCKETKQFESIPLNRNEVFLSEHLELIEKRKFSNFIQQCLNDDHTEITTNNDRIDLDEDLYNFYDKNHISLKLQTLLEFSVLKEFSPNSSPIIPFTKSIFINSLLDTLDAVKRFQTDSKYLYSLHGTQDIIHGFLRKASVFGAITCYGCDIKNYEYISSENQYKVNFNNSSFLTSKFIICDFNYNHLQSTAQKLYEDSDTIFSHAIIITTDSNVNLTEEPALELIVIPAKIHHLYDIFIIKHTSGNSCPIGTNLLYFITLSTSQNPRSDLIDSVELYSNSTNVKILWSCFYCVRHSDQKNQIKKCDNNLFLTTSFVGSIIADKLVDPSNINIKELINDIVS